MDERFELAVEQFVAELEDVASDLPDGAPGESSHGLKAAAEG